MRSRSGCRTLAFVTPTGFSKGSTRAQGGMRKKASREMPGLYKFLSFPLWGHGLYSLLISRRSIRYFLERTWGSKQIDDGMVEYDYMTTHQPGAEHAPFAFLSGRLFSRDIRDLYERLTQPVWMPHGTRGDFKDFSGVDLGQPAELDGAALRRRSAGPFRVAGRIRRQLSAFSR